MCIMTVLKLIFTRLSSNLNIFFFFFFILMVFILSFLSGEQLTHSKVLTSPRRTAAT